MDIQAWRFSQTRSSEAKLTSAATCWYCDHKIAFGQRFCNKSCAEAFEEDELAVERKVLTGRQEFGVIHL